MLLFLISPWCLPLRVGRPPRLLATCSQPAPAWLALYIAPSGCALRDCSPASARAPARAPACAPARLLVPRDMPPPARWPPRRHRLQ
jgi:hypothetical protein